MVCGHCRAGSHCNSSTGECPSGCIEGWQGTSCQFRDVDSKCVFSSISFF